MHIETMLMQPAKYGPFGTKVDGSQFKPALRRLGAGNIGSLDRKRHCLICLWPPLIGLRTGHRLHKINADKPGKCTRRSTASASVKASVLMQAFMAPLSATFL